MRPKGTPAPASSVEIQVFEERVDLSNDMSHDLAANDWGGFCLFGVRRVVLAGGELDKLEGPKYAARRAELRRKVGEAARARGWQAAAASQDEADESDATEEEASQVAPSQVGELGWEDGARGGGYHAE